MRYALILLALGLATPVAARPTPSSAVDVESGATLRSSCTLSQIDGRDVLALDCVIRDTRQPALKRSETATVQMIGGGAASGLQVVSGAPRATRPGVPDLALHAAIDTRPPGAVDIIQKVVVLDAAAKAPADRIEVVEPGA